MALPDFKLHVPAREWPPLAEKLQEYGYTEKGVLDLLGAKDLGEILVDHLPFYQWRCETNPSPLANLVSFFLLGGALPKATVLDVLGERLLAVLMKCNAVIGFSGVFTCQLALYPCQGKFFFTDFWYTQGKQTFGKIYELGTDSYSLARITPRREGQSSLDLCTGSGVHAILSAFNGPTMAVDINPRALEYTKVNAALNSVECQTYQGDLYGPVEGHKFDLITVNPPFVPSPDSSVLIHRSPGESGEEVTERIITGLPDHLNSDGLFCMVLEYPIYDDDDYADRLERWLGQNQGWGIAVLWHEERRLSDYIKIHLGLVDSYQDGFLSYLESYGRLGIRAIRFACVFIQRLPAHKPNWKVTQQIGWPLVNIADQIDHWLQNLSIFHDPDWQPHPNWIPKLSRYVKDVWQVWNLERGLLETTSDYYFAPTALSHEEIKLALKIREGQTTLTQLQAEWCQDNGDETSFMAALRGLGLKRGLEPPLS